VLALAAPLLAAGAIVAALAHVAQARAVWMPRRRVEGAPDFVPPRIDLVHALVIGGVAFGWLWLVAPRLALLSALPLAGAAMIASALATFAIAWVVLGVLDALLRHRALALALHMTARERREDERLASGDPRWRRYRAKHARVDGATLVLAGDDTAAAISWDPVRRPVPTCIASGRGPRATQLVALARRDRTPIHRDVTLATLPIGPVAERHWARLAEIVAAVKR
jgi:flagellar biosynthesis protein FlhB